MEAETVVVGAVMDDVKERADVQKLFGVVLQFVVLHQGLEEDGGVARPCVVLDAPGAW